MDVELGIFWDALDEIAVERTVELDVCGVGEDCGFLGSGLLNWRREQGLKLMR